MNTELIGFLGGAIVSISLLPQVLKSWRTKSTKDISISWNLLLLIGLILWVIYGFNIQSRPIMVFTSIEAILTTSLLALKLTHK